MNNGLETPPETHTCYSDRTSRPRTATNTLLPLSTMDPRSTRRRIGEKIGDIFRPYASNKSPSMTNTNTIQISQTTADSAIYSGANAFDNVEVITGSETQQIGLHTGSSVETAEECEPFPTPAQIAVNKLECGRWRYRYLDGLTSAGRN